MRVLISGGAGFIASHMLRYFVRRYPNWEFFTLERLNYAASLDRLVDLRGTVKVMFHDLRAPLTDHLITRLGKLDYIIHAAAETHVDRSMADPRPFVESNVVGTLNMLEYARLHQPSLKCFFHISTDEVYGPAPSGVDHAEGSPHLPSNPYSATKAGAEDLVFAWHHSLGVPAIITNTMNNIGEMQHHEKFIPRILRALATHDTVTVHGTPDNVGSRKYLYVADHADAIAFLMQHGHLGERYNVVGDQEVNNLEIVRALEELTGQKAHIQFVDFHAVRPGHDRRYSLDGTKMAKLGWTPPTPFPYALDKIVRFWQAHPEWT